MQHLPLSGWIPLLFSSASPSLRQHVAVGNGYVGHSCSLNGFVNSNGICGKAWGNLVGLYVVPVEGGGRRCHVRGHLPMEDKVCMKTRESIGEQIILQFMN